MFANVPNLFEDGQNFNKDLVEAFFMNNQSISPLAWLTPQPKENTAVKD